MRWVTRLACALVVVLGVRGVFAQAPEARYVLEPNDILSIKYVSTPEYDHTATVQPDGYLSAPLIGELKVAGLTLPQAREAIVAAAARRLRDPEVYVDLREFDKLRFTVVGEVGTPGRFDLRGRTTVLDAIATAGGLRPSSKHSQVLLLRPVDRQRAATYLLDVKRLMQPEGAAGNVDIAAGDILVVPQNKISKIERIVRLVNFGFFINPFDLSN
jgi:polysaccharide export outer membrane protein